MTSTKMNCWKRKYGLLFLCFTLPLTIRGCAQDVGAAAPDLPSSVAQSASTVTAIRGRHNGKLVFTSDRHNTALSIWTMNPDSSSPTRLTDTKPRGENLPIFVHIYDELPVWSPDGTKIAFISNRDCGADARNLDCESSIYIMNADGSNVERILINGIQEQFPEIRLPAWSPDGTKFAFDAGVHVTVEPARISTNIYTVNVNGTNLVKLTNDTDVNNSGPTWSPDSSQIAYQSNREDTYSTAGFG